jgi:hypothetical protein
MEIAFPRNSNHRRHEDRALPKTRIPDSIGIALYPISKSQVLWRPRLPENQIIDIMKSALVSSCPRTWSLRLRAEMSMVLGALSFLMSGF